MNEPKTVMLWTYACSNGSGMADTINIRFQDQKWSMWKHNAGHPIDDRFDGEKELMEDYQSVMLVGKSVCVITELDEVIQG